MSVCVVSEKVTFQLTVIHPLHDEYCVADPLILKPVNMVPVGISKLQKMK